MNSINNKQYTTQYIVKNFNLSDHISFEYKDYLCTIRADLLSNKKDKTDRNTLNFYIVCDRKFYEMEILYYKSIEDLFQSTIIDGQKLIDIWNDIKITSISKISHIETK